MTSTPEITISIGHDVTHEIERGREGIKLKIYGDATGDSLKLVHQLIGAMTDTPAVVKIAGGAFIVWNYDQSMPFYDGPLVHVFYLRDVGTM